MTGRTKHILAKQEQVTVLLYPKIKLLSEGIIYKLVEDYGNTHVIRVQTTHVKKLAKHSML